MKKFFTEIFLWIAVLALYVAKAIDPELTINYMALLVQEFLEKNVGSVTFDIDGEKTTVEPELFVFNYEDNE